jgi:hypothetical protein
VGLAVGPVDLDQPHPVSGQVANPLPYTLVPSTPTFTTLPKLCEQASSCRNPLCCREHPMTQEPTDGIDDRSGVRVSMIR